MLNVMMYDFDSNELLLYFRAVETSNFFDILKTTKHKGVKMQTIRLDINNHTIFNAIMDFLNNLPQHEFKVKVEEKPVITKRKKGKWAKVADEMKGTMSPNTVEYLKACSQELRSGFELRDLK